VQLTDRAGNIMRDHNGKTYSKKFGAGGTAKGVAGRLTKDLGLLLRGKDRRTNGSDRSINYPKQKWV